MFYIGVYQPRIGGWEYLRQTARVAWQMGAQAFFTINAHAPTERGAIETLDFADLHEAREYLPSVPWVALETDGSPEPLAEFIHPQDAIYLLGPQNGSLPRNLLRDMAAVVKVETGRPSGPLPVPIAAGIVLHDRAVKLARVGI